MCCVRFQIVPYPIDIASKVIIPENYTSDNALTTNIQLSHSILALRTNLVPVIRGIKQKVCTKVENIFLKQIILYEQTISLSSPNDIYCVNFTKNNFIYNLHHGSVCKKYIFIFL